MERGNGRNWEGACSMSSGNFSQQSCGNRISMCCGRQKIMRTRLGNVAGKTNEKPMDEAVNNVLNQILVRMKRRISNEIGKLTGVRGVSCKGL